MRVSKSIRFALSVAAFAISTTAFADVNNLLSKIPPGANAIAVINVKGVIETPMGKQNNWKEKLADAYAAKPLIVPPDATQVVLAAWINPSSMRPVWEASVMELSRAPSMERIAKAERGFTETVADKPAAWSPINAYFIRLDSRLLGALSPADRQYLARWANQSGSVGDVVSPYLQSAINGMDPATDYLFAFDLQNAVSPKRVRRRIALDEFDCLVGKNVDAEKFGATLGSLKGVNLQVDITDAAAGKGVIEFGQSAAPLAPYAKALTIEALGKFGVAIDDFQNWDASAKGNTITLSGKLSREGLRELFSIVDPPSPVQTADPDSPATADKQAASGAPAAPADNDDPTAAASKSYYGAVGEIIDGLNVKIRRAPSMIQSGTYIARDARRIDRLPILHVDPALIQWGTSVSTQIDQLAGTLSVGGFQARSNTIGIQNAQINTINDADYSAVAQVDPNDAVNRINVTRQRRAALAAAKAQTGQAATQLLRDIETSRAQVRAAMTQKYNTNF